MYRERSYVTVVAFDAPTAEIFVPVTMMVVFRVEPPRPSSKWPARMVIGVLCAARDVDPASRASTSETRN